MRFFLIGITCFQSTLVVKLTSFLPVQNIKISFLVSSFLGTRPFLVPRLTSLAGKVLSGLLYLFLLSTAMQSAIYAKHSIRAAFSLLLRGTPCGRNNRTAFSLLAVSAHCTAHLQTICAQFLHGFSLTIVLFHLQNFSTCGSESVFGYISGKKLSLCFTKFD